MFVQMRPSGQQFSKDEKSYPVLIQIVWFNFLRKSHWTKEEWTPVQQRTQRVSSGQCCACFGPKGGQKKYCAAQCKTLNGGTVVQKAHVFMWERCMDFNYKHVITFLHRSVACALDRKEGKKLLSSTVQATKWRNSSTKGICFHVGKMRGIQSQHRERKHGNTFHRQEHRLLM